MNERIIDIKDMLLNVLLRWKAVIIAGLIGLVLLGGYRFYKSEAARNAAGTEAKLDTVASENLKKKQREIRAVEVKINGRNVDVIRCESAVTNDNVAVAGGENTLETITGQIELQKAKIAEMEKYLKESVYMNIDPYARPTVRTTYQVVLRGDSDDNAKLYRDPADEIVAAYAVDLNFKDEDLAEVAQRFGFDVKYANELYTVSCDAGANTITVMSYGLNDEMAAAINEAICAVIESRKETISNRYWYHSLSKQEPESFNVLSTSLADQQNDRKTSLLSARATLETYEKNLDNTNATVSNALADIEIQNLKIAEYRDDIAEYEEDIEKLKSELPALESKLYTTLPSRTNSVKAAVKYGIIGLIAGMVIAAGLICVIYILKDTMHTADEIRSRFGLPLLAIFQKKPAKKSGMINKSIAKLGGKQKRISDEDAIKAVAASIGTLVSAGSVVLLGTKAGKQLVDLADSLNGQLPEVHFVPVADNDQTAESVQKLIEADAVVLVEERNVSSMRAVASEIEKAKLFERRILGYIVV